MKTSVKGENDLIGIAGTEMHDTHHWMKFSSLAHRGLVYVEGFSLTNNGIM